MGEIQMQMEQMDAQAPEELNDYDLFDYETKDMSIDDKILHLMQLADDGEYIAKGDIFIDFMDSYKPNLATLHKSTVDAIVNNIHALSLDNVLRFILPYHKDSLNKEQKEKILREVDKYIGSGYNYYDNLDDKIEEYVSWYSYFLNDEEVEAAAADMRESGRL
jgi:uncharacterized protein YbgA (DUF1722 family)